MTRVYINKHTDYNYAIAIIDGYVDIREYVKNVEWLMWDSPRKYKNQLMISGNFNEKGSHLEKVDVITKRFIQLGVDVFVRDERGDAWEKVEEIQIEDKRLLEIECEISREEKQKRQWILEDIEKSKKYLKKAKDDEQIINFKNYLEDNEIRLADLEEEINKRKRNIIKGVANGKI